MAHDGTCINYEPSHRLGGHRYVTGQSFCKRCERFIVWDGGFLIKKIAFRTAIKVFVSKLYCPCCNSRLRINPRTKKSHNSLNYCSKCESNVSFVGKRQEWFRNDDGQTLCSKCYFEMKPPCCKRCGRIKTGKERRKHWYFPDNGGSLCRICYNKKYMKKNMLTPIILVSPKQGLKASHQN